MKKEEIYEISFISRMVKNFSKLSYQLNDFQESDSELIRIPGTNLIIAITSDNIVEEIEKGLYDDPYLIGWMTVISNLSDLAAVGATPIGILLNETLPANIDEHYLNDIQKGIEDACLSAQINVLGGDTNFSSRLHMGGCALGLIRDGKLLMRKGCRTGDLLMSSGKPGQGNSYAFLKLISDTNQIAIDYQPKPRIKEGLILREYAGCCIDTSDGLIAALDQLMRLNNTGFEIKVPVHEYLHEDAINLSENMNLPFWWMLAGPHGEFELVFTIPPTLLEPFIKAASGIGWNPVLLGTTVTIPGLKININGKLCSIDTGKIRNLPEDINGDLKRYISELKKIQLQFIDQ